MPNVLVTALPTAGGPLFFSKPVSLKSWDDASEVQTAVGKALLHLGDVKKEHKKKGLDPSKLPGELVTVAVQFDDNETNSTNTFRVHGVSVDAARKHLEDALDKELKKF